MSTNVDINIAGYRSIISMVEAFSIRKATGRVIKTLLKEIILRYAIQESESEESQVSQQEQSIDFIKG